MTCTRGNGRRAVFHPRNWFSTRTRVHQSKALKSCLRPPPQLHRPPEDELDMTCDATSTDVFCFVSSMTAESSKTVGPKTVSHGQTTNHGDRTGSLFLHFHGATRTIQRTYNLRATVFLFSSALSRPNSENEKLAECHSPERDNSGFDARFPIFTFELIISVYTGR